MTGRWQASQKAELTTLMEHTKRAELEDGYKLTLGKILPEIGIFETDEALLDVCCGPISILEFLPRTRLMLAVDSNMKEYGKKFSRKDYIRYETMQAEDLAIKDEIFDKCFCLNALDHTIDFRKVLSELFRVTKRGGMIILSLENLNYTYKFFYWLGVTKLNAVHHIHTISAQDIKREVLRNIDRGASFSLVPIWEKVTWENIINRSSRYHRDESMQISLYTLTFFPRMVHYFILPEILHA